MGRLYDKQDLIWNTNYWRLKETQLHQDIANGLMPASTLEAVISYPSRPRTKDEAGQYLKDDSRPTRHLKLKEAFQYEVLKERGKLRRTVILLSNLQDWQRIFKACIRCYVETKAVGAKSIDRPCDEHEEGYRKAKSDVYWAGEHNLDERRSRGQLRPEELPTTTPTITPEDEGFLKAVGTSLMEEGPNPLNKWESQYNRDKSEGAWTPLDAKNYDVDYNYKGWLNMLLQNEELSEKDYLEELQRLRAQERELEELAAPTDRNQPSSLPKNAGRGKTSFSRDSRYNQLSN